MSEQVNRIAKYLVSPTPGWSAAEERAWMEACERMAREVGQHEVENQGPGGGRSGPQSPPRPA